MLYAVIGPEGSLYKFPWLKAHYPFLNGDILCRTGLEGLVEGSEAAVSVLEGPAGCYYGNRIFNGKADGSSRKIRKGLREKSFLGTFAVK